MLGTLKSAVSRKIESAQKRRLIATGGAPPSFYDWAYGGAVDDYLVHYSQSRYLPVWEAICSRIPARTAVLEVGCGPGQFAQMLVERGVISDYVGFDFSPGAIELARKNIPGYRVEVDDARATNLFETVSYDIIVCTEVLEHIIDDIPVLKRIPGGRRVLATVPNFDYQSHVRFFASADEVRARYESLFDSLEITKHYHAGDSDGSHGVFYLLDGVRRN